MGGGQPNPQRLLAGDGAPLLGVDNPHETTADMFGVPGGELIRVFVKMLPNPAAMGDFHGAAIT